MISNGWSLFKCSYNSRNTADTIYALATPHGKAGIGVIRISGALALPILQKLTKGGRQEWRHAHLHKCTFYALNAPINSNQIRDILDSGMAVLFQAPRSFTGENVVELHTHSSPPIITAFYKAIASMGARLAERGEFTERAFWSGKIDAVGVEGLQALMEAETEEQRKLAIWENCGLSNVYQGWRSELLRSMCLIEALIDFSEEDGGTTDGMGTNLVEAIRTTSHLQQKIEKALDAPDTSEIIRTGPKIVIVGAPNTGKSSLFNLLAGREAAIVSKHAGTTRDLLEVQLELAGHKVRVFDTAGMRDDALGEVEMIGIEKAKQSASTADLLIHLVDERDIDLPPDVFNNAKPKQMIKVHNKADLHELGDCRISCMNRDIDELLQRIEQELRDLLDDRIEEGLFVTRHRHKQHLTLVNSHLLSFLNTTNLEHPDIVIAAEYLRDAGRELAALVGGIGTEEILGQIFASFCIGK